MRLDAQDCCWNPVGKLLVVVALAFVKVDQVAGGHVKPSARNTGVFFLRYALSVEDFDELLAQISSSVRVGER